jgi:hypothetical protein
LSSHVTYRALPSLICEELATYGSLLSGKAKVEPSRLTTVAYHRVQVCPGTDSRLLAFGYTVEGQLNLLILPMDTGGKEALGSMGNYTPLAYMSAAR